MKTTWKFHFVRLFISLSIIAFVTILVFCYVETRNRTESVVRLVQATIRNEENIFQRAINDNLSDVLFLKEEMLTEFNYHHQLSSPAIIAHLAKTFVSFSKHRAVYDQISFIGVDGQELIKVNNKDGRVIVVPKSELQNKKNQYYYAKSIKLKNNEVYFSALDLNIEHQKMEYPFRPIIHISSPVFSQEGKMLGIVILNYNAQTLFSYLKLLAQSISGNSFIINQDGQFLLSMNPKPEWGNVLQSQKNMTIAKLYPTFWKKLNQTHASRIYTKQGVFFVADFTSKIPALDFSDLHLQLVWILHWIEFIPVAFSYYLYTLLLLLVTIFCISFLWALYKVRQIEHEHALEFLATIDPLTKVSNRRELFKLGKQEFDRAKRFNKVFSVLMIDIDFFKQINDKYGHLNGDKALVILARTIVNTIRKIDLIARFGGEEFVLILPETQVDSAKLLAEKIRQQVQNIKLPFDHSRYSFTVSIGVSGWNKQDTTIDSVIKRADENLYKAKEAGRNRVVAEI